MALVAVHIFVYKEDCEHLSSVFWTYFDYYIVSDIHESKTQFCNFELHNLGITPRWLDLR